MKKFLIIFILLIGIVLLDGFFINSKGFKVVEESIEVASLENSFDGFKIMQISDFLIKNKNDLDNIKNIVKSINERKPDIVVFTGDLINSNNNLSDTDINNLTNILKDIDCTLYKYAIYGDNDLKNIDVFNKVMTNSNFIIIDNESKYLFYKDVKPVKITGLKNNSDISKALYLSDELDTTLNLVLTHNPDDIDLLSSDEEYVVLAGGSLKGQVRIPFFGGIIKKDGYKKYTESYYNIGNIKLYNSGGIGNNNVNFRLFNKPEINLYRLEKK